MAGKNDMGPVFEGVTLPEVVGGTADVFPTDHDGRGTAVLPDDGAHNGPRYLSGRPHAGHGSDEMSKMPDCELYGSPNEGNQGGMPALRFNKIIL